MKNIFRRILLDILGKRRENGMWRVSVNHVESTAFGHVVLFGLDGKLGDAILQSCLIRAIKNAYSECSITIITATNLEEYWRECSGVTNVFTVRSRSDATTLARLMELRRLVRIPVLETIDYLISFDPIPMIDYFAFIRWARPRNAIGLSAIQYSIFHISISDPILEVPKTHIGERFVRTLAALGVNTRIGELQSIIPRSINKALKDASAAPNPKPTNLFINGYGASPTRTFSTVQLADIVGILLARKSSLTITINVNQSQRDSDEIRHLCEEFPGKIILSQSNGAILDLFNKLACTDAVLTPDTSVAHIAAATGTPMAVVYDDRDFNPICWRPLSNYVIRLVPTTPGPISRFSAIELVDALEQSQTISPKI